MESHLQIDCYFSAYLLPSIEFFPLCFDVQIIWDYKFWVEEEDLAMWVIIQKKTNSDNNDLWTLHAPFLDLSHAQLNGHSTGDKQGL